MEYKIFRQRARQNDNDELARAITKQFDISLLSAKLLVRRGIASLGEAEEFLHPKLENLYNPNLFEDMEIAADRIHEAQERGEKVTVYADYDCDGVCAAAIMYKALVKLGINASVYLPDRFSDGYGMNPDAVARICEDGTTLIITVDCGITNRAEIAQAAELSVDTILTDHHTPPDILPSAYAIINPKRSDEYYPFKQLCGAGIALKLALALGVLELNEIKELILLAGIATIADLVPLVGENRTLASLAVSYIREHRSVGIAALIKQAGLDERKLSGSAISFQLAPRINASGRLDTADTALSLLLCNSASEAAKIAKALDEANLKRKKIEEELCAEAVEKLDSEQLLNKQSVLFIALENANEGVIGIAAGRLAERYNRPCIIAAEKDGILKASARSIAGFDLYDALNSASELYLRFGGHAQAAGFTIAVENFHELAERVNRYAAEKSILSLRYKRCFYDITAVPSQLTDKSVRESEQFAPFGIGNPKSIFLLENVHLSNITAIGGGRHLRANVVEKSASYPAVGFSMGELAGELDDRTPYDILCSASINDFRNRSVVQLEIKNITPSVVVPAQYEQSLYRYFYANLISPRRELPEGLRSERHTEDALREHQNTLYLVFGRDALSRTLKFAREITVPANISFSEMADYAPESINVLVNPINLPDTPKKLVALDLPRYFGYNEALFNGRNIEFVASEVYKPEIQITREYVVFIYKRLKLIDSLGNELSAFIALLNTQSEVSITYFTLRCSLDIMAEMGIITYRIDGGKLFITFEKISGQRDINSSPIMIKLNE